MQRLQVRTPGLWSPASHRGCEPACRAGAHRAATSGGGGHRLDNSVVLRRHGTKTWAHGDRDRSGSWPAQQPVASIHSQTAPWRRSRTHTAGPAAGARSRVPDPGGRSKPDGARSVQPVRGEGPPRSPSIRPGRGGGPRRGWASVPGARSWAPGCWPGIRSAALCSARLGELVLAYPSEDGGREELREFCSTRASGSPIRCSRAPISASRSRIAANNCTAVGESGTGDSEGSRASDTSTHHHRKNLLSPAKPSDP